MKLIYLLAFLVTVSFTSPVAAATDNFSATGLTVTSGQEPNGLPATMDVDPGKTKKYDVTIAWGAITQALSGTGFFGVDVWTWNYTSKNYDYAGSVIASVFQGSNGSFTQTLTLGRDTIFDVVALGAKPFSVSNFSVTTAPIAAVPGPEAGAGLGAIAIGGMAVWLKRRRKGEALTA